MEKMETIYLVKDLVKMCIYSGVMLIILASLNLTGDAGLFARNVTMALTNIWIACVVMLKVLSSLPLIDNLTAFVATELVESVKPQFINISSIVPLIAVGIVVALVCARLAD